MIETITLLPGVTLRCYPDSRFKQGCLSFQIVRRMDAQEASMNALLPSVLLRGTHRHPDIRAITARMDELYGASAGALVRRVGDYQTTGLYCAFMDDRFCLPGDEVVSPMIDFLGELLFDAIRDKDGFDAEFVESEKKNLFSAIESERNDKRAYAMSRLLRIMCSADSYGIPRLGEKEDVTAIDRTGLYRHYMRILRESPIEIFYVGSAPSDKIAQTLAKLLAHLDRAYQPLPPQSAFRDAGGQHVTESLPVTQGKLCLGYVTPITNRAPEFAAMQVVNMLFGAGMTSKLFMNVREKLSLCYAIDSAYSAAKGIVTVSAGIDFDREALARAEIARQLDAICNGEITDAELLSAKQALLSSLRGTHDSPGSIEGYYSTSAVGGLNLTPQQYMQAVENVDTAAAARAAQTLTLHTTYFLRGVDA